MIGSEGVLHLSKAPFKNLKDIGFGDDIIIKSRIWFHIMERNGLIKPIGRSFKGYVLVFSIANIGINRIGYK